MDNIKGNTIFSLAEKKISNVQQDQLGAPDAPKGILRGFEEVRSKIEKQKSNMHSMKNTLEYAKQETPFDEPKAEAKIRSQASKIFLPKPGAAPAPKAPAKPRIPTRKAASLVDTDSDDYRKARILARIKAYAEHTAAHKEYYGGKIVPTTAAKSSDSLEILEQKLKEVENEMNTISTKKFGTRVFYQAIGSLEMLNEYLKVMYPPYAERDVRLWGLARAMQNPDVQEDLNPLVHEFMIKHDGFFGASVELRLAGAIAEICVQVNQANHHPGMMAAAKAAVEQEQAEKLNDLKAKAAQR